MIQAQVVNLKLPFFAAPLTSVPPLIIETERLILRAVGAGDGQLPFDLYANDLSTSKYMSFKVTGRVDESEFFAQAVGDFFQGKNDVPIRQFSWTVREKSSGEFIGSAGFGPRNETTVKESEQVVARYIERAPLSLEKLSLQDDIVTYTTKDGAAHEFDALEFLAVLSVHIPKTYESITRYYGRYSCRRRGERAKLSPPPVEETESDSRREFRRSGWAACIKRIYEIDPLECPKCKAQMRICAFIQDQHSIKDIMKAQGIPDFQAPPPIPKFIDTVEAIDELPSYDSFEPSADDL